MSITNFRKDILTNKKVKKLRASPSCVYIDRQTAQFVTLIIYIHILVFDPLDLYQIILILYIFLYNPI